jgi:hypothetical protein
MNPILSFRFVTALTALSASIGLIGCQTRPAPRAIAYFDAVPDFIN